MYIFSEKKTSVNVGQSNQNNNFSYTVSSMLKLINNKYCHKTDDVLRPQTKSICRRQLKSAFNKLWSIWISESETPKLNHFNTCLNKVNCLFLYQTKSLREFQQSLKYLMHFYGTFTIFKEVVINHEYNIQQQIKLFNCKLTLSDF